MTIATSRNLMLCIVLTALVLRTILAVAAFALNKDVTVFYDEDTIQYIEPAQSLLTSGTFVTNGLPEILRTPGYPLLFIPGIVSGHIEAVTIALQIVLGCIIVFLVYSLGILLFDNEKIAVLAAALYAAEPTSVLYVPFLYSETLFTTLLVLFLYFLLRHMKTGKASDILVSAVLLAAATYTRPISVYVPALVTAVLGLWIVLKKARDRRLLIHAAVFFCISMGLIGLWQVRNKIESGYAGFSAISANNLYFLVGAGILAEKEGIPLLEQQTRMGWGAPETYFSLHPEQRTWGRSEIYQFQTREGIKLIIEHPWTHMVLFVQGTMRTLRDSGAWELVRLLGVDPDSPRGIQWIKILRLPLFAVLLVYWVLVVIGCFSRRWTDGWQMVVLAVVSLYLLLIPGLLSVGYSRFRYPVSPVICLMAGCGVFVIMNRFGYTPRTRGGSNGAL
jgi:4-amino-4-deoxy-L-arabinose transferase-like glycosyltransferase